MGNMIRTVAARSISQFISKQARSATRSVVSQSVARHTRLQSSALNQNFRHPSCIALTTGRPVSLALQRYATTTAGPPYDRIDEKTEAKIAREELEARPDEVSTGSSVRHVTHEVGVEEQERDIDMLAGVKSDLVSSPLGFTDGFRISLTNLGYREPSGKHLLYKMFRVKRCTLEWQAFFPTLLRHSRRSFSHGTSTMLMRQGQDFCCRVRLQSWFSTSLSRYRSDMAPW